MLKIKYLSIIVAVCLAIDLYSQSSIENLYIENIENELIKVKIKYSQKDADLFLDIQDVLVSLRVDNTFPLDLKIKAYDILLNYVQDINSNIYADKKIEDFTFRKAARVLPSTMYYLKSKELDQFLLAHQSDAYLVMPYIYKDAGGKSLLYTLAENDPLLFYQSSEELSRLKNFNESFEEIVIQNPSFWVKYIDKSPILEDIITHSTSPVIMRILKIKKRMGNETNLYGFIDEIIRNQFNDSHEVDIEGSQKVLLKMLMNTIINPVGYGRISALELLDKKGLLILEDYRKNGESVLHQYSVLQVFLLMIVESEKLNYEELKNLVNYIYKYKDGQITQETISAMPQAAFYKFLDKLKKEKLVESMSLSLTVEAATSIVVYTNNIENKAYPYENKNWITRSFSPIKKITQPIEKVDLKSFKINKGQMALMNWTRNLNNVDSKLLNILNSGIGSRFLDYLIEYQPQILLNNREAIKNLPNFSTIIRKIAIYAPLSIKKYLPDPKNPITQIVSQSTSDPACEAIMNIYNRYQYNSNAYALLDKIIRKEINIDRAHQIGESKLSYLKTLMDITTEKNPIGIHSVETEQNELSLKYIRSINDNPSEGHSHFSEIRQFSDKELYSLMVLGKEEIFQFAFDHFYQYFVNALGPQSFIEFLKGVNYYKYRDFCVLMANFNKFPELIYRNSTQAEVVQFLNKFIDIDVSDINSVEEAASVCEFINNCENNEIQKIVQNRIKEDYDNALTRKDQYEMAMYSLLGSNIGHRALVHQSWFHSMEQEYSKYTLSYINVEDVKNSNSKIIEVCYFYNDADGIASFNSFVSSFRNLSGWYLQDLGSYYYISSISGNEIEIFANKPQQEEVGQQTIKEYLIVNSLEPTIVVHRGHSYHSQKTINQMVGSPRFIFMGSCGGYYKIQELLLRSPDAQILSTKQVGTMSINDPMLVNIHELLRQNKNIDWPKFWSEQEAKMGRNKHFKMYIPPHKNNGALFINALFKVVEY